MSEVFLERGLVPSQRTENAFKFGDAIPIANIRAPSRVVILQLFNRVFLSGLSEVKLIASMSGVAPHCQHQTDVTLADSALLLLALR